MYLDFRIFKHRNIRTFWEPRSKQEQSIMGEVARQVTVTLNGVINPWRAAGENLLNSIQPCVWREKSPASQTLLRPTLKIVSTNSSYNWYNPTFLDLKSWGWGWITSKSKKISNEIFQKVLVWLPWLNPSKLSEQYCKYLSSDINSKNTCTKLHCGSFGGDAACKQKLG